jgi:hypothetical protein
VKEFSESEIFSPFSQICDIYLFIYLFMLKLAFPPPKIEKLVGFYTTEKK